MGAPAGGAASCQVVSIIGTRPEGIKMAPLVQALEGRGIDHRILLTGQHAGIAKYLGSRDCLQCAPDLRDLGVVELSARLRLTIRPHLLALRPELVLVQGDTASAYAGAFAARDCGIPVGHVEAGLRSHVLRQPWPEEGHRIAIDEIATLLFAPTEAAAANLLRESRVNGHIHLTGNTGIDALLEVSRSLRPHPGRLPRLILVTVHRRENTEGRLADICKALKRLAGELPVRIAFPLHPNRHIRSRIEAELSDLANVALYPPLDYREMVQMMIDSWAVLTDSGGLQEEGPTLGKPVLVMREVTERSEAPANVQLVGTDPVRIVTAVERLLTDEALYAEMSRPCRAYGDGHASVRIASIVDEWLSGRLQLAI